MCCIPIQAIFASPSLETCRLTNRNITTKGGGKATKGKWITKVKSELEQLEILLETVQDRSRFQQIIPQGVFPEPFTSRMTTGTMRWKWAEQRKLGLSQNMKALWAQKEQKAYVKSRNEPHGSEYAQTKKKKKKKIILC